jgi:hypothetical protein
VARVVRAVVGEVETAEAEAETVVAEGEVIAEAHPALAARWTSVTSLPSLPSKPLASQARLTEELSCFLMIS